MCELSLQFIKARLAQACRDIPYNACYCTSNTVLCFLEFSDKRFHARRCLTVWAPYGSEGVNNCTIDGIEYLEELRICSRSGMNSSWREQELITDRTDKSHNLNS